MRSPSRRAAEQPPPPGAIELVPANLPMVTHLSRLAPARPWLRELPTLIAEVRERYQLRLAPPLVGAVAAGWRQPSCPTAPG